MLSFSPELFSLDCGSAQDFSGGESSQFIVDFLNVVFEVESRAGELLLKFIEDTSIDDQVSVYLQSRTRSAVIKFK